MTNVSHEKFSHLMAEIEDLEEQVEALQTDADSVQIEALRSLQEKLAEKRNELARISDGCGTPHPMG